MLFGYPLFRYIVFQFVSGGDANNMIGGELLPRSFSGGLGPRQTLSWLPFPKTAWLFVVLLAIAPTVRAQGTGNISGYVRDSSGAVLSGTNVTAVMTEQHTTRTAQTDAQGFYNFVALPAGHYTITFEAKGFQTEVRSGIELTVSQNARADAQLSVGIVQSKVEVTSTVPLVDTTSNTLSGLVDDRRVVDLPLNGRNVMALAALVPGVTNVQAPQTMSSARDGSQMNVSGSLANASVYTFDGAFFQNVSRNTGLNFPPPDAIAQFRILTSNFSAEYGHNSGAQIEVVSRAGTNSYHGAAWEFFRNSYLNAKNYFASNVPFENQHQFGAALGGPVIKRKVFFFGSYQGLTNHQQAVSNESIVPTAAERSGDFTGSTATLIDPTDPMTGLPLTDPATGHPCVAANVIAPGCISPVAVNILKYIPIPQSPTGTVVTLGSSPILDNMGNIRVDWNQSARNLIFGHYYQDNTSYVSPGPFAATKAYDDMANSVKTQDMVVNDIYTFNPSIINQAIFSILNTTSTRTLTAIQNSSLGINLPQYTAAAPEISAAGDFDMGGYGSNVFSGTDYQVADNLTWMRGRHSLTFGFQTLRTHFNQAWQGVPEFSFSGIRSGDPLADLMLGAYDTTVVMFGEAINDDHTFYNSFYAQDQFRINPRLVLTYGLRYAPFLPYKDKNNLVNTVVPGAQSKIDPTAPPGFLFPGDRGITDGIAPANLSNFAPRVGFALDVFGDGKTSVRGGYGLFFNAINADSMAQYNPPYTGTLTEYRGDIANPFTSTGQSNPPVAPGKFGCNQIPTYPYYSCADFPLPLTGLYMDTKLRLPYYSEFDLSVQRQINPSTMFQASYVGNIGSDEASAFPNNPALFIMDPINGAAPSESNVNDRVPFEPGILAPSQTIFKNWAHSNYNALEIQATKRFGHGSTILANYTWAKSMDLYSLIYGDTTSTVYNPINLNENYGPSDYDRRNSFVVSWLYAIPIHLSSRVANGLLSGWTVSAIQSVTSGRPITFVAGEDVAVNGTGAAQFAQLRPGATAGTIQISHPNRASMVNRFFNTQAFVPPNDEPLGTYGNSRRGMVYGPAYANTDASVLKLFTLPESLKLQFRLETFNTFNQVNFSNPNSTANSGGFGKIRSAASGRQLQLALKLIW